jgi:hypothetical protein
MWSICALPWNVPHCETRDSKMYTVDPYFFFFVFVNCYQRRVLAIRVTNDSTSVTRLLNTHRCYLHISDASSQYTSLLSSHQWRVFSIHVATIFTSMTCLLNTRRCYLTSVTHLLNVAAIFTSVMCFHASLISSHQRRNISDVFFLRH